MLANISDFQYFQYYISPYPANIFSPEKVIRLVHIFKCTLEYLYHGSKKREQSDLGSYCLQYMQ